MLCSDIEIKFWIRNEGICLVNNNKIRKKKEIFWDFIKFFLHQRLFPWRKLQFFLVISGFYAPQLYLYCWANSFSLHQMKWLIMIYDQVIQVYKEISLTLIIKLNNFWCEQYCAIRKLSLTIKIFRNSFHWNGFDRSFRWNWANTVSSKKKIVVKMYFIIRHPLESWNTTHFQQVRRDYIELISQFSLSN